MRAPVRESRYNLRLFKQEYVLNERHTLNERPTTHGVDVGKVRVGGGAPIAIQSMTNTDTADIAGTARQCIELATAGSEMVRITVNVPEAAAAVPANKRRSL